MSITEYTEADHNELESLKAVVWREADKEHYIDSKPHFFKEEFTLLAKDDGRVVGYCIVLIDTGVAHLEPLMVAVERKGQGIGTMLLKAAEEKAKSLGAHKIWLETGAAWKAKAFYEKNEYIIRAVLPNHNGNQDFVLMDKML